MTSHNRDKIIAAAKEAGIHRRATPVGTTEMFCWEADIESFYTIAFEAGRQAEQERCAKIAWNYEPNENGPIETAIRARGDTK